MRTNHHKSIFVPIFHQKSTYIGPSLPTWLQYSPDGSNIAPGPPWRRARDAKPTARGLQIYVDIYIIYIGWVDGCLDGWMDGWLDGLLLIATKFDCGFYFGVALDIWMIGWMKHPFKRRADRT